MPEGVERTMPHRVGGIKLFRPSPRLLSRLPRNDREVFERLHDGMVVEAPQTKNQEKKAAREVAGDLPVQAVKGLAKGSGTDFPFAPAFFLRMKLRGLVKELGEADDVLRRHPLTTLSEEEVCEACNLRGMDVTGRDQKKLRNALDEWLRLTSAPSRELSAGTVFLPDRARLLGLGLNYLDTVRSGRHAELSRKACSSSPL